MFETAGRIKRHNHILELIEDQISYDLSRSFHSQVLTGKDLLFAPSTESLDGIGAQGEGLQGYFNFIDFVQLQVKAVYYLLRWLS